MSLVEAKELAMTDWACCRLRLGMEWLPSLCCLLKGRAGYLAERVDKAERVQTLLQSALLGSNPEELEARNDRSKELIQSSSTVRSPSSMKGSGS